MKKLCLLIIVILSFSSSISASAFSLDKEYFDAIEESNSFFDYLDDITFDPDIAERIILEPLANAFIRQNKIKVIQRKAKNDESALLFEGTLPSMVEEYKNMNNELDENIVELEKGIDDLYSIISSIQSEEQEYSLELFANRSILIKRLFATIQTGSPIEQDAIYQLIRINYRK